MKTEHQHCIDAGGLHSLSKDLAGAGNDSGLRYRLTEVGSSGSSDKRAPASVSEELIRTKQQHSNADKNRMSMS
jgi:hypothetical protein